jgi:hypothetical protein
MPTNVFLVRWKDGWHEVVDAASVAAHPRHEAFLALGSLQSIPEVDRVAGMQLSVVAYPRVAVAADHDPIDLSDRPYRSYNVGDIITVPNYGAGKSGQRVRSITGAEDDDGEVTYSPELGDLVLEEQERVMQAVKKMSDGTLEGDSPVAQPTRVYVSPVVARPIPKVKPGGLRIYTSGDPVGFSGQSQPLNGGDSGGEFTLRSFTAQVPELRAVDGVETHFVLKNYFGDISYDVAEINLGVSHAAGTFTGTILRSTMSISGGWEIMFEGGAQMPGPFTVTAYVTNPNQANDVELTWYPNA